MAGLIANPTERSIHMSLIDVEKLISGNLNLLGFTPSDRSRLWVAAVRAYNRIDEIREKRETLIASHRSTGRPPPAQPGGIGGAPGYVLRSRVLD